MRPAPRQRRRKFEKDQKNGRKTKTSTRAPHASCHTITAAEIFQQDYVLVDLTYMLVRNSHFNAVDDTTFQQKSTAAVQLQCVYTTHKNRAESERGREKNER